MRTPSAIGAGTEVECVHCALPVPRSRRGGVGESFCCFGCRVANEITRAGGNSATGSLQLRLGLGLFLAMNIMAFSGVFYARELFGSPAGAAGGFVDLVELIGYLQMFLGSLVLALLGLPLLVDAVERLQRPAGAPGSFRWASRVDANLLIVIGVGSAYVLSAIHTVRGSGSIYYDTAAMILVIVTLGQYLEAGARQKAAASARRLLADLPELAWVRRARGAEQVATAELCPGDLVRVRPGEACAVDGVVDEGRSHVDESSLSGESRPRGVAPGDTVYAGTISLDGQLWVSTREAGSERVVARVQRLLESARAEQPPIQRVVDRVASVFVPGVVTLAAALFLAYAWTGRPTHGLWTALSVLLISCPCALGLAAPLASWHTLRRAAERGILIRSAATLEPASRIRRAFIDKTGTLTRAQLQLTAVDTIADLDRRGALRLAAAVESSSLHPVAATLVSQAARERVEPPPASEARPLPGLGVEARVEGTRLRLGSPGLLESIGLSPDPCWGAEPDDGVVVYLADERRPLARFVLAETIRPDAAEAMRALARLGVRVELLSGDRRGPVSRVAERLGLPFRAGLLPQDKLNVLTEARDAGEQVAMVGDGLNDAPVLGAAHVGFAVGSATDLARQAGSVQLISDRLDRVPLTLAIARHGMRRVRLNLVWAFGYNLVGIGLAAFGLLSPVFAALAMFGSSITVVLVSRGAGRVTVDGHVDAVGESTPSGRALAQGT